MESLPTWRRILLTTPGMITSQSAVPVITLALFIPHHIYWPLVVPISVSYGVITTIVIRKHNSSYARSLGLSSSRELWILDNAIKTGKLPGAPELRKALALYLERYARSIYRAERIMPINIIIFGLFLLGSIVIRDWTKVFIFGVFLAIFLYTGSRLGKNRTKVDALRGGLGSLGITADSPIEQNSTESNNPLLYALATCGVVLLIGLFAAPIHRDRTSVLPAISKESATFSSTKYRFRINFPTTPSSEDDLLPFEDASIPSAPYTRYSSITKDRNEIYEIVAFDWPAEAADFADYNAADTRTILKDFINQDVVSFKGKVVQKQEVMDTPFANRGIAEEVEFSYHQHNGATVYGFIKVFTIDNYRYDIVTLNTGSSSFHWFASTFSYDNPDLLHGQLPNPSPSPTYNDGSCSTDISGCEAVPNHVQDPAINPQTSGDNPQSVEPTNQPTILIPN